MVHMVKKSLTEYGDKLDASEKEAIEKAIKDVEEVLRDGDKDVITAKTEALSQAAQKLGEKMYAQQQAEGAAAGAGAEAQPQGEKTVEGDVVDAEFTEVNKDKKA
jgi:molecular chaperone DnaK